VENLCIEAVDETPVSEQAVEIVERKGTGHPDHICDAASEAVSIALCAGYMERFGVVLHHNADKGLLIAGEVEKRFGGGRVIRPMEFVVGDRATFRAGSVEIPVARTARRAVRAWFAENLRHVDPARDLKVRVALGPGSVELADIFERQGRVRRANDTSVAVGCAPMTPTERCVLEAERLINSDSFKQRFPETGEDVKVMGIRRGTGLELTVAVPLMASLVSSEKEYFYRKRRIREALRREIDASAFTRVGLRLNALDARGRGVAGAYLTLLGTSAEDADSGQVGRGNRVSGVISLNRPAGAEAAAGKNPTSHVGKIYGVLAHRMAVLVYDRLECASEVRVWILGRIGRPVDRPVEVYVRVLGGGRMDRRGLRRKVASVVEESLSSMGAFTGALARGEYPVC